MSPKTFIFIGRSGCGKGTQAKLLAEMLQKEDGAAGLLYLETGKKFRELIENKGYTNDLVREIIKKGQLQPEFLAFWNVGVQLVENLKETNHLVIDGIPRTITQAEILDGALAFYKREKPTVVLIEVSAEWATKRMQERSRGDDNLDSIQKRMAWHEEQVVPAINYLKNNPRYEVIAVNGEQDIDKVHADIVSKIHLG